MRETALPSPGPGSKSMHLRRIAANAISALEVTMNNYSTGAHPDAAKLSTFFAACKAAADEAAKSKAVLTFTLATPTVAVSGTDATTLAKGGSTGAASYASSNTAVATVNGTGVVTGVAAGTATITVNVAGTSTYRPATAYVTVTVTA